MAKKVRKKSELENELRVADHTIKAMADDLKKSRKYIDRIRLLSAENEALKSKLEELKQLALIDELTGIYNHRHIMGILDNEIARTKRIKGKRREKTTSELLSILMLDLDHFKNINDSFGHPAGNAVLMQFSKLLKEILRKTDFYGRYGGEEFLIILPGTAKRGASIIGGKLRKSCENLIVNYKGEEVHFTFSGGIAELKPNDDAFSLIARADKRLYAAKNSGRNKIVSGPKKKK